ncbi:AAA family ATPase [Corynebacterium sp. zg912]|uniref:AAA family ATPase n=1 Tax=Corynebacterium wankanglinii TaxID=2735136 RepID=A0A7H0K9U1_9CORY|nr:MULTISPECIES: AAA family ATPase [Corynebacterium]MBA1836630.1 AAA family ATPase [Corynebacterium wankanglinii]MCR5928629.1 AAA family ATPase [Corynebacterium sp. zg912]QNP94057.1 AAA family ATPase [Corynebacterium wankanglinii]
MFIEHVVIDPARAPQWALATPAIAHVAEFGFALTHPITLITGGNGVGKSTLLEGMARAWGFAVEGGTWGVVKPRARDPLYDALTVRTGARAKAGYFLRGETHTTVTEFGGRSHGESVMELTSRFIPNALYLLDEPESGLSAVAQMALLSQLHALAGADAQVIAVTHSPIVLGVPGAEIVEVGEHGIERGLAVEGTLAFRAMRDFLADPHGIADYMADWAEGELG